MSYVGLRCEIQISNETLGILLVCHWLTTTIFFTFVYSLCYLWCPLAKQDGNITFNLLKHEWRVAKWFFREMWSHMEFLLWHKQSFLQFFWLGNFQFIMRTSAFEGNQAILALKQLPHPWMVSTERHGQKFRNGIAFSGTSHLNQSLEAPCTWNFFF